jgi:MutS domain V
VDDSHPYAADLDLFGRASLFELLCTARTRAGQETLAAWLKAPAPRDDVLRRQAAVAELRPRLDLREDLALTGEDADARMDPSALVGWSTAPLIPFPRHARAASAVLAALNVLAAAAWALGAAGGHLLVVSLAVSGAWAMWLHERVERTIGAGDRPSRDLALFAQVLARLERERFETPLLRSLRERLDSDGLPPSRQLRRLARLQDLLESRRNQFFMPIALPLLWSTQVALAIESWRRSVGHAVPEWLRVAAELEALGALASHAYERPADVFPDIATDGPCFDARGLGHPLLPEARCVRNDLRLDGELRLLVVTGSNMSGKSTLLRTAGVNVVLALAGAPVRAGALRLSPMSLGASIRIQDSLEAGASRFYAEITRLRQIMGLARERPPLLVLLDEILHGTNSDDRRVGAEAVVRGLLDRGAAGLVTSHDLALARIADDLAPRARNVHFEDHLEDGRIAFDYKIKDGVVRRSNALALMRAVGLEV